jgi:CysZ protein
VILVDFLKALGQLGDPRFVRVLGLGVALALALLVGASALVFWLVDALTPGAFTLPWVGEVTWVGDFLGLTSIILMLIMSIVLMVPVASAITSMFLDDVADAVEAVHYPALGSPRRSSFAEAMAETFSFLGIMLAANIAALLLWVMVPPAAPLVFYALNGFLLGREYFFLVALRRLDRQSAREMARRHRGRLWLAGTLMALPLSVPLVNLAVPVLGAATFTHLYHRLAGRGRPDEVRSVA